MSTLSQFGFGGGIKSIQTITQTQNTNSIDSGGYQSRQSTTWSTQKRNDEEDTHIDITINPVDPNKTILITDVNMSGSRRTGGSTGSGSSPATFVPTNGLHYAELVNSTTLRIKGPSIITYTSSSSFLGNSYPLPTSMRVQIIEFN
jgi:hypothetical protein